MRSRFGIMILLILFATALTACIDEELFQTQEIANRQLTPGYSLPIGQFRYDMNEYLDSLAGLDDTSSFIDTIIYLGEEVPFTDSIYQFTDSIELRLAGMNTNNQYIEFITLLVRLQNYYPTEISYQGYFKQENRMIIDSVFQDGSQIMDAGRINFEVTDSIEASTQLFEAPVSDNVIDNVDNINYLFIHGSIQLQTRDTSKLSIRSSYHIRSDLSFRIGLRYNTGDVNP